MLRFFRSQIGLWRHNAEKTKNWASSIRVVVMSQIGLWRHNAEKTKNARAHKAEQARASSKRNARDTRARAQLCRRARAYALSSTTLTFFVFSASWRHSPICDVTTTRDENHNNHTTLERLRDFSIERCDRSEKSQRCRLNSRNLSKRARNHNNPSNFLKNHNFFILDPILDPKRDLECSTKIDFSYDTFSLIEKVSKQR